MSTWRKVWDAGNDGAGSGLDADLLDGQQGSYYAAASTLGNYLPLTGGELTGTLRMMAGNVIELRTSSNSTRGYIGATESNDAHLIIATSGGEDISFRDGGISGGVNMRIRGDGDVFTTRNHYAQSFIDLNDSGRYVNPNGTSSLLNINMNNGTLSGVNHIIINDPGPTEGISWAGGNLWRIAESPDNISTNSGGNLQIIQNATRRATFRTDGSLNLPSGVLLSNVTTNWQQSAAKTNLLRGGNFSSTLSNDTSTIKIFPAATGRAAGNYWGGMYFMHLDPQNSSWGTSYTGGQMWIGGRVIDQPGQERSALVFATNNATGAGSHPSERMAILPDGNVVIGQTAVSYTNSDNTPLVGAKTNSKLHINGGIQLANNNDAIVFGRGTSTFMKDEEIGFGWGGGLYMTDGTYLRIRNNKIVYSTGEFRGSLFNDYADSSYYVDPASTSNFNCINANTFNGTLTGTAQNAKHLKSKDLVVVNLLSTKVVVHLKDLVDGIII